MIKPSTTQSFLPGQLVEVSFIGGHTKIGLFPVQEMPKGAMEFYMDNLVKDKMMTGVDLYHFIDTERNFFLSFQSAIEITEGWHGKVLNTYEWQSLYEAYRVGYEEVQTEPHYFDPNVIAWMPVKSIEKPKPVWSMTDNFALKLEHPGLIGLVEKAGRSSCEGCYFLDESKCHSADLMAEPRAVSPEEQKTRPSWCPLRENYPDKFAWSV